METALAAPTALEQYMLELLNRARSNPTAEAARYGIDLNQGLLAGTIGPAAKQPLAFQSVLNEAADRHSRSMLEGSYFSHTGSDGSSATDRIFAAGWQSSNGGWRTGENISYVASFEANLGVLAATIDSQHEGLFKSAGHRTNILSATFSEVGIDQAVGPYLVRGITYPQASMITQNFADGGRQFITGVAIDDRDADRFYDPGEGLGGVTVTAVGGGRSYSATTWASGGYSLEVAPGTYTVTFTGGALGDVVRSTVVVGTDNVKVDAFAGGVFDAWSYLASHRDLITAFGNRTDLATAHFAQHGAAEGRARDTFDEWSYMASHVDLARAFAGDGSAATRHYVEHGFREGRVLDQFDEWSYLASHLDLVNAFGTNGAAATRHYVQHGIGEGRAPDRFDEWSYLASHSDLTAALGSNGAAGTRHYVEHGLREGRAVDAFDEVSYLASYGDLIAAFGFDGGKATRHFVDHGFREGRVRDAFDELRYIASNRDLIGAFGTNGALGTQHYVTDGHREGRSTTSFDPAGYLARYADLRAAYGSDVDAATRHFITNGFAEGRTDDPIL